ncbi:MAG: GAF domain-containing protein [Pseudonocardia sp.]|nr:GAF domain-containing protein [Pseudonocardia sp.]
MVDLDRLQADLAEARGRRSAEQAQRICEVCVEALPMAGAAISIMSDVNRREIMYATDVHSTDLEELQFTLGEGPCVEAFSTGRPVLVADLGEPPDPRWPMFAAAARADTPARAAFAFPLQAGAIRVGVLDLYRLAPGSLGTAEVTASLLVADACLWALLDGRAARLLDPDDPDGAGGDPDGLGPDGVDPDGVDPDGVDPDGVDPGWPLVLHRDHTVVYQASGMVMGQTGGSVESALAVLRAYAYAHDRSLPDVAAAVVARRLNFDERDR